MRFDQNSMLGELLASDADKAVLEKHLPGFSTNPMIGMASGFTLSQLAGFPQTNINSEKLTSNISELTSINE